ncbi:GntR family transcriptional regulator [Streptomyces indicus]|uniref:DNA-binding transcriptional regulator, GntR family n=1 Tax=Streptomyces indicus TaxID=417292 RepID=A0A1G9CED5_9ACTN|nr:GntR family transcriptional regulator [Streptomyces indicus]SDK49795.1 DNA-binding transcriptional regulator, GntR family [Streptomyces indicus]
MRTAGSTAVTRSTLRQQIADALRDEVLAGRLAPGQEFTVKEIAEQYGVSATPVREALVDLSAQGLLDSAQHRGFKVHEYTVEDYRGMVEARALVAEAIFRGIAERGIKGIEDVGGGGRPEDSFVSVRRRAEEAARAAAGGDLNVLIGYDLRFWRELSSLFGNTHLTDFLHRLRVQSWAFAVPVLRTAGSLEGRLWSGHTELVDAVGRRDASAAYAIVTAYNRHSLELVDKLAG